MIKAMNEAPKGFKSPGYEKVLTTMLSAEKLDLEAKLSPIVIHGAFQGCPSFLINGKIKGIGL